MKLSTELKINDGPLALTKRAHRFSHAEREGANGVGGNHKLRGFHAPQRKHFKGPNGGSLDKAVESCRKLIAFVHGSS